MLEDGISFPLKGDNVIAQHIIGGMLWLFSWLLFPAVLVVGYYMDTMRAVINGSDTPPSFGDWGAYTRDGIFAILITLAYFFIPMAVLIGVVIFTGGIGFALGSETGSVALLALGGLISVLLYFFAAYFLAGAIVHTVHKGTPSAAFAVSELKQLWLSKTYFIATIVYFIGGFAATVAFTILSTFTFGIGALLYPFFMFYYYQFGAYVFAKAYRDVYDTHTPEGTTTQSDTATPAP